MNRAERRAAEPIIDRFRRDMDEGRFRLRYDPGADILTMVIYRPDNPITFQDSGHGTFIDFDPDEKRFSALTIMRFRKGFIPAQASAGQHRFSWRARMALQTTAVLDTIASWVGLNMDRYWNSILSGDDFKRVMSDYRDELKSNPDCLADFGRIASIQV